jgi:hypothetical protein
MPSGTLYHVALIQPDVSENASPLSSGFFRMLGFNSCVDMESLLISLCIERYYLSLKNTVFWDFLTVVSIIDAFWDIVPCSCHLNNSIMSSRLLQIFLSQTLLMRTGVNSYAH